MDSFNNTFHYSPDKDNITYTDYNNSGKHKQTFILSHAFNIENQFKSEAPDEYEEPNAFNNYNSFEKSPD